MISAHMGNDDTNNGVRGVQSTPRQAPKGVFHESRPKHLDRYFQTFFGKHNLRDADSPEQVRTLVDRMDAKGLRDQGFIGDNGLDSGERS